MIFDLKPVARVLLAGENELFRKLIDLLSAQTATAGQVVDAIRRCDTSDTVVSVAKMVVVVAVSTDHRFSKSFLTNIYEDVAQPGNLNSYVDYHIGGLLGMVQLAGQGYNSTEVRGGGLESLNGFYETWPVRLAKVLAEGAQFSGEGQSRALSSSGGERQFKAAFKEWLENGTREQIISFLSAIEPFELASRSLGEELFSMLFFTWLPTVSSREKSVMMKYQLSKSNEMTREE